MLRQYVCNIWKGLQIGKHVKFRGGSFETEDPKLQELVERNNAFGSAIHFKDSLEEMERIGRERDEKASVERIKERKRVLREIADEEKAEADRRVAEKAEIEAADEERERLAEIQRRADDAEEAEQRRLEEDGSGSEGPGSPASAPRSGRGRRGAGS